MPIDTQSIKQVLDFQARAKDYPLDQIPGYSAWSERKLNEGVSPAVIAHMDAMGMLLRPEELDSVEEELFEEILEDLQKLAGDY